MLLKPTPISTSRLTWHAAERMLSCEASDLGSLRPSRVWDDACDEGFTLVSHRTGSEIVVCHWGSERDAEGELLWDDYLPAEESAQIVRGAAPSLRLRIWND